MTCIGPVIVFPTWWWLAIHVFVVLLGVYNIVRFVRLRRTAREIVAAS